MTGRYAFPFVKIKFQLKITCALNIWFIFALHLQLNVYTTRLIYETFKENGNKCRMTFAREPAPLFLPYSFLLAKNGPYTQAINEQ